jgi:hypothetical protein
MDSSRLIQKFRITSHMDEEILNDRDDGWMIVCQKKLDVDDEMMIMMYRNHSAE